jgi:hypothetical protein
MEGCRWEGQNLQLKEVQRLMKKKNLDKYDQRFNLQYQEHIPVLCVYRSPGLRKLSN